jgi:hypothetical protein
MTPVLYEMEPIGLQGADEANGRVYFFCSAEHRDQYRDAFPALCHEGMSDDYIRGTVCDQCGRLLPDTNTITLDITPNAPNVFAQFIREAAGCGVSLLNIAKHDHNPAVLNLARNFVVALNIAAQSITTAEDIHEFRAKLNTLSTAYATADDERQGTEEPDDDGETYLIGG